MTLFYQQSGVFKRSLHLVIGAGLLMSLTACSTLGIGGDKKEKLAYIERPAELIYNQAFERVERADWANAKLLFEEVERQHPFSKWARRAILMSAYTSYRSANYDDSIATAQRFISLNPGNDSAPYAYYLIAINYYDQIYDVGRDQATTLAVSTKKKISNLPRLDGLKMLFANMKRLRRSKKRYTDLLKVM